MQINYINLSRNKQFEAWHKSIYAIFFFNGFPIFHVNHAKEYGISLEDAIYLDDNIKEAVFVRNYDDPIGYFEIKGDISDEVAEKISNYLKDKISVIRDII